MKRLACLLLLLLATPAWSQSILLPPNISVPAPGIVTITPNSVDGDEIAWVGMDSGLQFIPSSLLKDSKTAVGVALQPGVYRVRAIATKVVNGRAVLSGWSECVVTVGKPGPVPPGPIPPEPKPPVPPNPVVSAVKVLILEESAERTKLSAGQIAVMLGKPMRDWLNAKCATDATMGSGKAWAIQDKDTDLSGLGKFWADAAARPRTGLPWIVIADQNGTFLYGGPLPADTAATQALIGKYLPTTLRKAG